LEDYILNQQFDKAQVITCTPVAAAGRMIRNRKFTTLFIDEAAQALEPMCWIPIGICNRVIFAGDHFQLPPTVKSKIAEEGGLKETSFERCMEIENVSIMLNTQYRMHEHIMEFSNQQFYKGNLLADLSVKESLLDADSESHFLSKPITFIDTAGCGYNEILNPESLSISNPEEAILMLNHLKLLLLEYQQSETKSKVINVGIISPYKEQVHHIKGLVEEDEEIKEFETKIVVKTIDGFQGQERNIIYISLVRSNDNREIGFLNDIRRMNVALTRAKEKLVVIGDSATLANHFFYKSFIDYIESIDAYASAYEFIK
jgi:ATP-dependent RNA/DNA helicase IGHMBP2